MPRKYKLTRKHRETGVSFLVGTFDGEGDALWCATLFSSLKSFGEKWVHYVEHGKSGVFHGAAAIQASAVNLIGPPAALNSLQELSAWMRSHTGPKDGTQEMLTRAVEAIKATGEQPRDSWGE